MRDLSVDEAAEALQAAGTFRFGGGVPIESIKVIEERLGERFPAQYVLWLLRWGGGGAPGSEISGIFSDLDDMSIGTVLGDTYNMRETGEVPEGMIVLLPGEDQPPWCLRTRPLPDGSCPVVTVQGDTVKTEYPDFDGFFADYVVSWAQEIGGELRKFRRRTG